MMEKVFAFSLFNFQTDTAKKLLQVILLIFPLFYFSIATDSPIRQSFDQHSNDSVIYISSATMMVGVENIYHARIVKESAPIEERITKKAVVSKIDKPSAVVSVQKKSTTKIVLKPAKPKFLFNGISSEENFGVSDTLTNKNSVINPTFVERTDIACHFTELSVALYVYLLNYYGADFSKTSELSQFRFSRPPPMI